ncbi:orotate phosphoribosyltransferase [Deltaproteobacteria bacterium TL4]
MQSYKIEFIEFIVKVKALQFGEFTLKSGRISPYFFNASLFNSGTLVSKLGYFYAKAAQELDPHHTVIFGPSYKGIPLCVTTAIAMSTLFNKEVGYFFDRKEQKTHGDKGILVGYQPQANDRIIMVDDVITDGLTKKEALKLIEKLTPASIIGIIVAVDRMERNAEGENTLKAFQKDTGVPVRAIVSINEISQYLLNRNIEGSVYLNQETYDRIETYLKQFCV